MFWPQLTNASNVRGRAFNPKLRPHWEHWVSYFPESCISLAGRASSIMRMETGRKCETNDCLKNNRQSMANCFLSWLKSKKEAFKLERVKGCFAASDVSNGGEKNMRTDSKLLPVKAGTVNLGSSGLYAEDQRSFVELVEYFDGSPTDLQYEILMRLARSDKVSFVAWCFARRASLRVFQNPEFWKLLLKSENRHVPSENAEQKLFNFYYRRFFRDKKSKVCLATAATTCELLNIIFGSGMTASNAHKWEQMLHSNIYVNKHMDSSHRQTSLMWWLLLLASYAAMLHFATSGKHMRILRPLWWLNTVSI